MSRLRHANNILTFTLAAIAAGSLVQAQNAPLTVSPAQLTFNTQNGVASSQNLVVFSNVGTATFTASATSPGNWLSVSPTSGTSPQVLTISANPASLNLGTYGGFVTITSGNNSSVVPVILNVNTSGTPALTANPPSLAFSFQASTTVPQSQQIAVSSTSGGPTSFTATSSTSNGGNWLTVTPNAGTSPGNLAVSVNPSGLNAGMYFGAIALNPPGTTGLVIPVQVSVAAPSTLNVSPQQLSFAYQTGQTAPTAQTLTLTSAAGSTVSFTASSSATSCGSNWLVVSPQSSATPSTLTVQINPTGLQPGNCTGTINIAAPGASNPTQSIPVSLLVSNNPLLQVPPTSVTFNYQLGTAVPASQTVQVTSSSTPLNFTATATPVSGGPNFLTVTPATGTTPQGITLAVNPSVLSGLAPNTYAENVTVSSAGAGNPAQTFTVTLNVSNTPTLVSPQPAVNFNFQIGQSTPPSQTITLTSTGAPLSYNVVATATSCNGFLTATPASGTTQFAGGPQSQVVIGVNTNGLTTPQTCTGNVTVSVPGSTAPPLTIPVTLNVANTPLITLSPAVINVLAVPGTGIMQQTIALTSTDFATPLNFTATAATNPAGLTWLAVAPNIGTSPASLIITINPANLAPGVYTGSINVSSTSTGVPAQSIPVVLTVATGTVGVSPTTLTFNQPAGGGVPSAQTIQVNGVPAGATVGATTSFFNGTNWLTVSTSGNTITVTPNGGSLSQGSYSGVVTVFVPGAANSPLYVPVTYTVGGASTFTLTPSTISATYQSGGAVPAPQTIQIASSTGGTVTFNAVAVAPPGTPGGIVFVTLSPASGTTPGPLTVTLNPQVLPTLAVGTYINNINITSPSAPGVTQTIPLTLTVTSAGPPTVTAVVSAASFQTGAIAPGELVSIFGSNIGPAQPVGLTLTPSGNVSTNIGNVMVTFNGIRAPLTYVSANQINAVVPYEIAGAASVNVVVTNNTTTAAPFAATVVNTAPSIFTLSQNGSGQGAIVNQDGSVNSSTNAAARGTVIAIYATGGGTINPPAVTGSVTQIGGTPLPINGVPVTVSIGGVAAQVMYAGPAPGLVSGVLQVNVMVPDAATPGVQPVVITAGGTSSSGVATVAVR